VGLDEALRLVGLPLEGTHHRGGDDAWNIAALLAAILSAARTGLRQALKR
jgi:inhibitor of KinA sporulation pathway (predicted exonuclease)